MQISIALATYNGAQFLREQLASLIGQTRRPDELVVSDDGSTDATLQIVREFADTAPFPVRIVPKAERLGFSDNFLFAAEACTGDLIAFCDQDDVWLPAKLERGLRRIVNDDSLLAMHTLLLTNENLEQTGHWRQDITSDVCFNPLELDPYTTGWGNTMLFKRELVELIPRELRPQQPQEAEKRLSHDTWIYMISAALGRVSHLSCPLILYRQHGVNASAFGAGKRWSKFEQLTKVPIERYRAQEIQNRYMSLAFRELAGRPGPFAVQAARAADRFEQRRALSSARVSVYDADDFRSRISAYRSSQTLADVRPWIGSRIKDIVLGVSGLKVARQ